MYLPLPITVFHHLPLYTLPFLFNFIIFVWGPLAPRFCSPCPFSILYPDNCVCLQQIFLIVNQSDLFFLIWFNYHVISWTFSSSLTLLLVPLSSFIFVLIDTTLYMISSILRLAFTYSLNFISHISTLSSLI